MMIYAANIGEEHEIVHIPEPAQMPTHAPDPEPVHEPVRTPETVPA